MAPESNALTVLPRDALASKRQWAEVDRAVQQLIDARRSENTRIAYRADWEAWMVFVDQGNVDLLAPGIGPAAKFRDDMLAEGYAPASVVRRLSTLSFLYGALRDVGLLRTNPFSKAWVPRPQVSDLHRTPAVDDGDVQRLEATIRSDPSLAGVRDYAIIRLLYDTGIRRASLASLRRDQIRIDGGVMIAVVTVKGGKDKVIAMTADAADAVTHWLKLAPASLFVFPGRPRVRGKRKKTGHIDLATINKILTRRARRARVKSKISPHRFRTAFITAAYDAKLYERDIQTAAHHANAQTTRGYDRGQRGDEVFSKVAQHRKDNKERK